MTINFIIPSDEVEKLRVLVKMFDSDIEIVYSPLNPGSMYRIFRQKELIWPLYESDYVTIDDLRAQVSRIISEDTDNASG